MKIYEQLLECFNIKNEIKFFEILSDLSDIQIDEILEFCQDMPDDLRSLLVDYEDKRAFFLNR